MNVTEKQYLGDGVYVRFDGYSVVVTIEDGIQATNEIVLEPNVISNFIKYINKLREEFQKQQAQQQ